MEMKEQTLEDTDSTVNMESVESTAENNSDCPQNEDIMKIQSDTGSEVMDAYFDNQQEVPKGNDEGYEGDMEGDDGLMPPPAIIPK